MIILIVLQSGLAVASSQQVHQIDTEHMSVEHSHESDFNTANVNDINGDEHDTADCHHCGHCHGSHAQWLTPNTFSLLIKRHTLQRYFTTLHIHGIQLDNLFRPPIA